MGKHSAPSPSDPHKTAGNVTDDTWMKVVAAAVDSKGENFGRTALRSAENARNN